MKRLPEGVTHIDTYYATMACNRGGWASGFGLGRYMRDNRQRMNTYIEVKSFFKNPQQPTKKEVQVFGLLHPKLIHWNAFFKEQVNEDL